MPERCEICLSLPTQAHSGEIQSDDLSPLPHCWECHNRLEEEQAEAVQDDCPHGEYLPVWTDQGWARRDVKRCKFCGKELGKWEREQVQLATEALAELMHPPHPGE